MSKDRAGSYEVSYGVFSNRKHEGGAVPLGSVRSHVLQGFCRLGG